MKGLKSNLPTLGLFALASFLLFFRLGEKSYWSDEAYSAMVIQRPWSEMLVEVGHDVHTPLYWVTLKIWSMVFGAGEFATRSLSALFALGALAIFFGIVRKDKMLPGFTGWLAALLLACSPFWLLY
ncbi:MAG: hypothetical protein ACREJQ_00480, partial [bacterium]